MNVYILYFGLLSLTTILANLKRIKFLKLRTFVTKFFTDTFLRTNKMAYETGRIAPDEDYGLDSNNVNKGADDDNDSNLSLNGSEKSGSMPKKGKNNGSGNIVENLDTEDEASNTEPISRSEERSKMLEMTQLVSSQDSMVYENSDSDFLASDKGSEDGNRSMSSKKRRMPFGQWSRSSSRSLTKKAGLVYNDENYLNSDPYMGLDDDDDEENGDNNSDAKVRQNVLHDEKKKKIVSVSISSSILIIIGLLVGLFYLKIQNKVLIDKIEEFQNEILNETLDNVPSAAPSTLQNLPSTNASLVPRSTNLSPFPSPSPTFLNTSTPVTLNNFSSVQPSLSPTLLNANSSQPSVTNLIQNSSASEISDNVTSIAPSSAPSMLNLTRLANIDDLMKEQSTPPSPSSNGTSFINSTNTSQPITTAQTAGNFTNATNTTT